MMTLFIFYLLVALPAGMYIAYILGHNDLKDLVIDMIVWPFMFIVLGWVVMKNYVKELIDYTPETAKKYRNSKDFRR